MHSLHILEYAEDKKPSNVENDDMSEGEEDFLDGHPHGEPLIIDEVDEVEERLEIGGAEHSWKNVRMLKSASALVLCFFLSGTCKSCFWHRTKTFSCQN